MKRALSPENIKFSHIFSTGQVAAVVFQRTSVPQYSGHVCHVNLQ